MNAWKNAVVEILLGVLVASPIFAHLTMHLWNEQVVETFGVAELSFFGAWKLWLLCQILFTPMLMSVKGAG